VPRGTGREPSQGVFLTSTTFAALGVPDGIVRTLAAQGIDVPFPIQAATIPDALAGRDICGRAPTGSGKTIAFGVPLVTRVARGTPRRPRGLVLVPTRELAMQVTAELRMLAGRRGPSITAIYGGVGFGPQVGDLRRGVDVVVACPGRLADLCRQGHVALDAVDLVVVDEADRLADMGFLPEVRRLLDSVDADRQTMLFSATLDGDIDVLVRRYQRNPVRHQVATEDPAGRNRHVFWKAERHERVEILADLLGARSPAIVFCRTKHGADRLARQLAHAGVSASAIHGNRTQAQRTRALTSFVDGKVQALVATDVAARGIHVDDVAVVVHFDPAGSNKDYIHRSGRTGRAGRAGIVVSFVSHDQHGAAVALQRHLGLHPQVERADIEGLRPEHARPPRRAVPAARPRPRTGPPRAPRPRRARRRA
jgi:superfamily II DNA/RNA helicase